jgi:hypothetical protein
MPDRKAKPEKLFERVENASDEIRSRRKQKGNYRRPLKIAPFFGYGTRERIRIRGRLFEDEGPIISSETDSVWRNIANMYRRRRNPRDPFRARQRVFSGPFKRSESLRFSC